MIMKKYMILILVILSLVVAGCSPAVPGTHMGDDMMDEEAEEEMEEHMEDVMGEEAAEEMEEQMDEMMGEESEEEIAMNMRAEEIVKAINEAEGEACEDWKRQDLVDAVSGETFQIKDFEGQVVFIESFAVWCPTCLKQQIEMAKVDGVVHVSIDTDPNEDESIVKEHAERNGLDWRFVVSPIEVTKALISEFGAGVVSAPRAPVIMVCEDQSTRFLPGGLKDAEKLKAEIVKGCTE